MIPHAFLSGFIYTGLGKYERAVEEAQKAVELDPSAPIGYLNLGYDNVYFGRLAEAEEVIRRASDRKVEMPDFLVLKYDIAFLKSDAAGMAREVALAQSDSGAEDWMSHHQAFALAYTGHLKQARRMSSQAAEGLSKQSIEPAALIHSTFPRLSPATRET